MNASIYPNLFQRYTENTNGKLILGKSLYSIFEKVNHTTLLDVGAGRGEITLELSSLFEYIMAIEPKRKFIKELRNLEKSNIYVIEKKIQDFSCDIKFDIILLSYFLDSISLDQLPIVMDKLSSFVKMDGKIVGATYLNGCDWDEFVNAVCNKVTINRTGGTDRLVKKLEKVGYTIKVIETLDTNIFGDDEQDLFYNLAFFFKDDIDNYYRQQEEIIYILSDYSKRFDKALISVKEVIFEVQPLNSK